ncbi:MAG: metalloregulator ArsR/SmtB family transcription factor, partial [Candidatus Dormibacteraeota bacterium]|nr:metalloregulator ArsR/SmtB family transcription factor [Candidatus Dormibacteraeota bacterium]
MASRPQAAPGGPFGAKDPVGLFGRTSSVRSCRPAQGQATTFGPDAALRALASPTLRHALELVATSEISSGELAETCGWTRPATSQHLRALRQANLVEVRVQGNRRLYRAR